MAQHASNTLSPPNIWKQMGYPPPRGPCAHKTSLMTPACPCLRFMIHPVKAASTFHCDGCAHHASFHKMENRADDEVVARWRMEEREKEKEKEDRRAEELLREWVAAGEGSVGGRGRKRKRIEGAAGVGTETLVGFGGRAGDELGEREAGSITRRAPRRSLQGAGTRRRVLNVDAEYSE